MLLKGCKMDKQIELDVGERRIINDMAVECTISCEMLGCSKCAFKFTDCSMIACTPWERKDLLYVYFKRVE